jgi:diguanylate cyclase (GGDEF)-like protein/PAS domain S-box-containing protein
VDALNQHAGNTDHDGRRSVEQRYRRLVDHSPDAIVVHIAGRLVYVNPAAVRWMAGESSAQLVGHVITEFVHPDSIAPMLARIAEIQHEGEVSQPSEAVMLRFDGTTIDVEAVSVLTEWEGQPAYQVIFRDLTAQKAAQSELRRAEQHFQTIVASLDHGVAVLDGDGHVQSANPAAQRIFGVTPEVALERSDGQVLDFPTYDTAGQLITPERHPVTQVLRTGVALSGFVFGVDRGIDGQRVWLSGNYRLLNPEDPAHSAVLVSFSDITAERLAAERLSYQANHDALTGLPNRALVLNRVTEALSAGGAHHLGAVLFIDLDNLKGINDSLGHDAGDEVLRIAAHRLRHAIRSDLGFVARFGGDEFVALLVGKTTRSGLEAVTGTLHAALAEPLEIKTLTVTIGASIGIVVVDEHDERSAARVLSDADTAMYEAKTTGGGKSHFFTDQIATASPASHLVGEPRLPG